MSNVPVPAASTGLPNSNVIPFPTQSRPMLVEFEPDAAQFSAAYEALCRTWQFGHLEGDGLDRAVAEMVRVDSQAARRMIRQNGAAIRLLYRATDFMMETDERLRESFDRVLKTMEA